MSFSSGQIWKWFQACLLYRCLDVAGQQGNCADISEFVPLRALLANYIVKDLEFHNEKIPVCEYHPPSTDTTSNAAA